MSSKRYDDHCPACAETSATLVFRHPTAHPADVTRRLEMEPGSAAIKDQPVRKSRGEWRIHVPQSGHSYWALGSHGQVDSRDAMRHIDWLLDQMDGRSQSVAELILEGWAASITLYWLAAHGRGGPEIHPDTMRRLGALNLHLQVEVVGSP